jgi:NAD+ diphosphatase
MISIYTKLTLRVKKDYLIAKVLMKNDALFIPGIVGPEEKARPAWWFIFRGDKLLVRRSSSSAEIPCLIDISEVGLKAVHQQYLGRLGFRHCYAAEIPEGATAPEGMESHGLRRIYGLVDEQFFGLAGRAFQIMDWDRTHQFCGRCGTPLTTSTTERAKQCPRCGLIQYPRLAPSIIVLIQRGHELLLGRSSHFPKGLYSVIAGFVEPGETLEEAVEREVQEEVGLTIADIRYFASQPWPFPHSLMIGFTAQHAGGDICIDNKEIEDARWFTADNLPKIPDKISIARKLIDCFLEAQGKPSP